MLQIFLYLTTKRYQNEKKAKEAEIKEMAHRKEDAAMTIKKAEEARNVRKQRFFKYNQNV